MWWTEVFPAFPRWVQQLQEAGLTRDSPDGFRLLSSVTLPKKKKGNNNNNNNSNNFNNSNNLIFKLPKDIYGEVPHFKGKAQNEALELAPMVAIEVYACVTSMYSMGAYY
jgi:hypothetical protein